MNYRNFLAFFLLVLASHASADEIEDQIKLGLEAYQQADYKGAIDELNYAIAQIREKLNAQQSVLLPEPPEGWTASEVKNDSAAMAMMGGGTNMSRTYTRGDEEVEIRIMANSPMVAASLALVNNPMLMGNDPELKPFRYKKMKGSKRINDDEIEIMLALAGQIMVQVTGSNTSEEAVQQFLDIIDFDKIKSSLLE